MINIDCASQDFNIFVEKDNVAKTANVKETPLMRQYNEIKTKYPDAVLLFRVGDFYETFGEDAIRASGILGITLTKRANGSASHIELAGFPYHSLETYLPKLVKAGQRVAICEQLEDPKMTKTIVKRGITELVTPGLAFSDNVLERESNNFLAAVYLDNAINGVAFVDVSTGEFMVAEGNREYIERLLHNMDPAEVILQKRQQKTFFDYFGPFNTFCFDDWVFSEQYGNDLLIRQFETHNLKGFGLDKMPAAIMCAGAALHYISETRIDRLPHIKNVSRLDDSTSLWLDHFTIRNLELVQSYNIQGKTLLETINRTASPMGARMLRRYLLMPLIKRKDIEQRHDIVEFLVNHDSLSYELHEMLTKPGDIERLIGKTAVARVNPRELYQLALSLEQLNEIKAKINAQDTPLKTLLEPLKSCQELISKIKTQLKEECPAAINKGSFIADGVSEELDALRKISGDSKEYLAHLQHNEAERTGISSLKVGFNNVFGYYLEVTNVHKAKVPEEWSRKQTLTNAERYITPELKEYEEKILGAEDRIMVLEQNLYTQLLQSVLPFVEDVQRNAEIIAQLDVLLSFSLFAAENNYCRPQLDDSFVIDIKGGRHPVIEKQLPPGEKYVENDVYLDNDIQQIIILTGPNMAGKSALLRQTALITLLAQTGSFVPADAARIGIVDKIFTRVGASDNLSLGESTFMVEMNETASILNNLSARSLILLDEIGRGTSTYDGISIAWSISEYLHNHPAYKAKTLFATHYHELNELATFLPRIKNYHISVKESKNKIIFIRKLVPGGTEHSFGIHVARMAGVPQSITKRADEILLRLEKDHGSDMSGVENDKVKSSGNPYQLSFIQLDDPLLENIRDEILQTDVDTLTPIEALMKLNNIKKMISGDKN